MGYLRLVALLAVLASVYSKTPAGGELLEERSFLEDRDEIALAGSLALAKANALNMQLQAVGKALQGKIEHIESVLKSIYTIISRFCKQLPPRPGRKIQSACRTVEGLKD